jgi:hypothetical protein
MSYSLDRLDAFSGKEVEAVDRHQSVAAMLRSETQNAAAGQRDDDTTDYRNTEHNSATKVIVMSFSDKLRFTWLGLIIGGRFLYR